MTLAIDEAGPNDVDALIAFAEPFERDALTRYSALPRPGDNALRTSFERRLNRGSGVIARENGEIVGCLLGVGPIPDFRPGHAGVYGPITSCLTSGQNQDYLFTSMFAELGNVPAFAGVQIAAFTAFPHHHELNASLIQNGFGVRCADSVVRIQDLPTAVPETGFTIASVPIEDAVNLREVKQSLAKHLAASPIFQEEFDFSPEFIAWKSNERQSIYFAARDGERVVGFIEATLEGENYLTRHPHMRNICGAGVLPAYRNRGIMRALLLTLANHLRAEGITVLGVDYETQNPQARGFWEQCFTPYTWSWERHFDRPWGEP